MEKIESFQFVIDYLKQGEIIVNKDRASFHYDNNKISVHNKNAHFLLSLDEFIELYRKDTFYLYTNNQESIDENKDTDYYSWKSKGVN